VYGGTLHAQTHTDSDLYVHAVCGVQCTMEQHAYKDTDKNLYVHAV
jgi:hypothetical protein